MLKGKIYIIIDGQAGSCGKGKFTGYFARHKKVDVSINNNTPNAGHTFMFDDGRKVVTTHIPIAIVNPSIELLIGPGACITPELLLEEIDKYGDLLGNRKIYLHERAGIVTEADRQYERDSIRSGSTFKGGGASLSRKIMRFKETVLAGDYKWPTDKIIIYNDNLMLELLEQDKNILIETSQGFDLGINHGLKYPNVSSRECSVSQALADCGIPNDAKVIKYMVFRPYPIRISNQSEMGEIYSGDYDDSVELMASDIEAMSGCENLDELTTRTKRYRRFFSFSYSRFYNAIMMNNPNYLILNFSHQLDSRIMGVNDLQSFKNLYKKTGKLLYMNGMNPVLDFINDIESEYGKPVAYIGTGPRESEQIDLLVDNGQKHKLNTESNGYSLTYYRRHF